MRRLNSRFSSGGSTLVVVLWALSILMLLSLGAAHHVWLEIKLAELQLNRLKEKRLALAAVELAKTALPSDLNNPMTLKDPWAQDEALFKNVRLDEGTFSVVYFRADDGLDPVPVYGLEDESARLNLNTAAPEALEALIGTENSGVAQSIVDWRQLPLQNSQSSAVDDFYASLPNPYPCKHAAFESLEELFLVKGMTPALYKSLGSQVTVYARRVNINTATPETLSALGFGSSLIEKVVRYRQGPDGMLGTSDDGVFANVASLGQNLPNLSPEESSQIAAAAPLLSVESHDVRMHVDVWPGNQAEAGRNPAHYEIVLESELGGQWFIKHFSRL